MPSSSRFGSDLMAYVLRTCCLILVLAFYFLFAPVGYLFFFLWSLLPTAHPERRANALLAIQRFAFRIMHRMARWLALIDYDPDALTPHRPTTPSVIVANHPTLTDTTAILGAFPRTVTVVKPALFRRWWARPLLHGAGFLEGATRGDELERLIAESVERLQQGYNVLIFPEGTRSPEGKILPFSRIAFEIACRANAPVVPIAIQCQPLWLSKEHPVHIAPPSAAKLTLDVLENVRPEDLEHSSRALRHHVHERIALQLAIDTSTASPS